jgi:transcriptional regulator with XRE-family HTH domain
MAQATREWNSERLRQLMGNRNLTTVEVAAALGVHQSTVELWLQDAHVPLPGFRRLLDALEEGR